MGDGDSEKLAPPCSDTGHRPLQSLGVDAVDDPGLGQQMRQVVVSKGCGTRHRRLDAQGRLHAIVANLNERLDGDDGDRFLSLLGLRHNLGIAGLKGHQGVA